MPTTHLLYLHGFRSSPASAKAQLLARRVAAQHPAVHWWCPQLPASPREAMALIEQGVADWPRETMAVVGSSLGGFYATVLAERLGCRAVVLNPVVHAARDLARHIGTHTAWHDQEASIHFQPVFIEELRALEPEPLTAPGRYHALIAKGDEVLDWREMAARYAHASCRLLDGGDHALSGFADQMDEVFDFLDLA